MSTHPTSTPTTPASGQRVAGPGPDAAGEDPTNRCEYRGQSE